MSYLVGRGRKMLKTIEAIIDPNGRVRLREPVELKTPQRAIVTILEDTSADDVATFLSEPALAEDWLRPEEDKAWAHLQKGP